MHSIVKWFRYRCSTPDRYISTLCALACVGVAYCIVVIVAALYVHRDRIF
jgi:hypothetical protein